MQFHPLRNRLVRTFFAPRSVPDRERYLHLLSRLEAGIESSGGAQFALQHHLPANLSVR
jgi:hypothetical protein